MDHVRGVLIFILAVAVVQFLDGLIFGPQLPIPTVFGAKLREVIFARFRR